ncbi:acyl-CoA-binding domain-containing protein 6-like isoform X2 [Tripterygium wilfordii]|uniref:acyl-CoA-binding domain-containing protein 6-like isoform X2 n=1 Tax=Tripterygium wilfordii TaxID=458696 RepID=UPI0018F80F5B|nr:acyl-CoA-binding domain-containing protein 6-like isoform X2 [Tripterygium wilfordii]
MFGRFSRRRMKLGRVKKVQLSDSVQGARSPLRLSKRISKSNVECAEPTNDHSDEIDGQCPSVEPEISDSTSGNSENWMVLSISGEKPIPRYNHAATVIGNRMIVVGGESANGMLDDVQVLNFDKFSWSTGSSKLYLSPSSMPLKIPACKGHSLVSWGRKALLIGGKTVTGSERISVWAFDTETECWSLMEAKGDIPISRSGHTVVIANSVLIMFGGEDAKKRKLNDMHRFDLKSLTWLPLHCKGTGPSPRSNHVATLYDDKTLFVFGGASKSRMLNDLYSLDFETMIWSRMKIRGFHPSPRAGCCGVLCGTRWYIAGGGSKKKRHAETLIFDILKVEWSVAGASPPSCVTANKGFSLVLVQHKEKDFLVAFGGFRKEASNQVEVMGIDRNKSSMGGQPAPTKFGAPALLEKHSSTSLAAQLSNGSSQRSADSVARQNLASAIEQHGSGRKSLSDFTLVDQNSASGNVSLRKKFLNGEESNAAVKMAKNSEDACSMLSVMEQSSRQSEMSIQINTGGKITAEEMSFAFESENPNPHNVGIKNLLDDNNELILSQTESKPEAALSSVHQLYEAKMVAIMKKNGILEAQLAAALASREAAERNLSSVVKSRLEMEKKLGHTVREMELVKERLACVEQAQEEANDLSSVVHSDNVRLEHDVAFLKAVLDDTQKELHSTRGVLAGERARAFQLQAWAMEDKVVICAGPKRTNCY